MAVTNTPVFGQTPLLATAACTAANTTLTDSPNNTVLLATAGTNGALITSLSAIQRATNTATQLYIYVSSDSGTTQRMIAQAALSATTISTTSGTIPTAILHPNGSPVTATNPLRLAAADRLYCGASVALASGIVFAAEQVNL